MGLFDGRGSEPEPTLRDLDNPQEDMGDARLAEESRARAEDMVQFNSDLIRPSRLKDSQYHNLLTKDLKISNLSEDDVRVVNMGISLVDHSLFLGFDEFASVIHAELIGFLATKNSVHGFERLQLNTSISQVEKRYSDSSEKKKGFRL
jgi:hypothetical protein